MLISSTPHSFLEKFGDENNKGNSKQVIFLLDFTLEIRVFYLSHILFIYIYVSHSKISSILACPWRRFVRESPMRK